MSDLPFVVVMPACEMHEPPMTHSFGTDKFSRHIILIDWSRQYTSSVQQTVPFSLGDTRSGSEESCLGLRYPLVDKSGE